MAYGKRSSNISDDRGHSGIHIILAVLQLIVSFIIFALSAWGLSILVFTGGCVALFTSLFTLIVTIWLICALSCAPGAYSQLAALILNILALILWIASLGLLAYETTGVIRLDDWRVALGAGLCGLESLLHLATLFLTCVGTYRHAQQKQHSRENQVEMVTGLTGGIATSPMRADHNDLREDKPFIHKAAAHTPNTSNLTQSPYVQPFELAESGR